MKTIVKEIQVKVYNPSASNDPFQAKVRDGKVVLETLLSSYPLQGQIEAYIVFLKEVLEAIEETKKEE